MAEVQDKATRSYNMSRIKDSNTKAAMLVRRLLHAMAFFTSIAIKASSL